MSVAVVNGLDLIGVGIAMGVIAILLATVPLAEAERKHRRREMGLSPTPGPLSELRREQNEAVERALERAGYEPLPGQALGHQRVGLHFHKPTVEDEIRADRMADFDPDYL